MKNTTRIVLLCGAIACTVITIVSVLEAWPLWATIILSILAVIDWTGVATAGKKLPNNT